MASGQPALRSSPSHASLDGTDQLRDSTTPTSRQRLRVRIGAVTAAAALAATGVPALHHAAYAAGEDCGAAIVDWVPDVGHPVAWGYEDLTVKDNAPRSMRVYYPSEHKPAYRAPLLQLCLGKWPVVLFLPGEVPPGLSSADYYQRWDTYGEWLARSGYVVVVPQHSADLPDVNYSAAVQAALADITYVQTAWSGSNYVDTRASVTTVGGHSNGALLAARIAAAEPKLGAYFSLGGRFHALPDPEQAAYAGGVPSFFMWGKSESRGSSLEDLHVDNVWDNLQQNRYAVRYEGEHFDYLPPGQTGTWPAGNCQQSVGLLAADLVTFFVAKFVIAHTQIDDWLYPPNVPLTDKQKYFANQSSIGIGEFVYTLGCKMDKEWWIFGDHGGPTN
jgi:hypothetical protein